MNVSPLFLRKSLPSTLAKECICTMPQKQPHIAPAVQKHQHVPCGLTCSSPALTWPKKTTLKSRLMSQLSMASCDFCKSGLDVFPQLCFSEVRNLWGIGLLVVQYHDVDLRREMGDELHKDAREGKLTWAAAGRGDVL